MTLRHLRWTAQCASTPANRSPWILPSTTLNTLVFLPVAIVPFLMPSMASSLRHQCPELQQPFTRGQLTPSDLPLHMHGQQTSYEQLAGVPAHCVVQRRCRKVTIERRNVNTATSLINDVAVFTFLKLIHWISHYNLLIGYCIRFNSAVSCTERRYRDRGDSDSQWS